MPCHRFIASGQQLGYTAQTGAALNTTMEWQYIMLNGLNGVYVGYVRTLTAVLQVASNDLRTLVNTLAGLLVLEVSIDANLIKCRSTSKCAAALAATVVLVPKFDRQVDAAEVARVQTTAATSDALTANPLMVLPACMHHSSTLCIACNISCSICRL